MAKKNRWSVREDLNTHDKNKFYKIMDMYSGYSGENTMNEALLMLKLLAGKPVYNIVK
jgi:hypothetical protein